MEPHVKERIVGAAVLVALGVWLIPMVLDGPDEVSEPAEALSAPGIRLQSPDEAAPRRTETVELQQSARRSSAASDETPENERGAGRPEVVAETPTRTRNPGPDETRDSNPVESQAESAAPAPTQAAAPAVPEPLPGNAGWSVQLGSFGDVANANQLVNRVASYGYTATVSEFRSGGRTLNRVRLVGLASENAAQAAASSLSAHGINVQVIPPE